MDPHRLHEWVTIHRRLVNATDTTMEQVMAIRGAPFTVHWTLTESDPPHYAHWDGKGPARSRAEIDYRLTETESGGTRFDYRNDFRAPGGAVGAVASRVVVGSVPQNEADATLQKLKRLIEG